MRRVTVHSQDILTLVGRSASVITAGGVLNNFPPGPLSMIDQEDLERIIIGNGLPGNTTRTIEYLVKGSGAVTIQYSAPNLWRNSAPGCTGPCGGTSNDPEARHVFCS